MCLISTTAKLEYLIFNFIQIPFLRSIPIYLRADRAGIYCNYSFSRFCLFENNVQHIMVVHLIYLRFLFTYIASDSAFPYYWTIIMHQQLDAPMLFFEQRRPLHALTPGRRNGVGSGDVLHAEGSYTTPACCAIVTPTCVSLSIHAVARIHFRTQPIH
jgi:hypothetical protein